MNKLYIAEPYPSIVTPITDRYWRFIGNVRDSVITEQDDGNTSISINMNDIDLFKVKLNTNFALYLTQNNNTFYSCNGIFTNTKNKIMTSKQFIYIAYEQTDIINPIIKFANPEQIFTGDFKSKEKLMQFSSQNKKYKIHQIRKIII